MPLDTTFQSGNTPPLLSPDRKSPPRARPVRGSLLSGLFFEENRH
ncbi:hypothetical protein WCP94_002417 [Bilophila wadsworthia]